MNVPDTINTDPVIAYRPLTKAPDEKGAVVLTRVSPRQYVIYEYDTSTQVINDSHVQFALSGAAADFADHAPIGTGPTPAEYTYYRITPAARAQEGWAIRTAVARLSNVAAET